MQQHADVLDQWVKQVMQFYEGIPGFTDLPLKDQMALIKGKCIFLSQVEGLKYNRILFAKFINSKSLRSRKPFVLAKPSNFRMHSRHHHCLF